VYQKVRDQTIKTKGQENSWMKAKIKQKSNL